MPAATDPPIADQPPEAEVLTGHDRSIWLYLRLLDAEAERIGEVARVVLHIEPAQEPDRARRAWRAT
jgi:hypothetical protein